MLMSRQPKNPFSKVKSEVLKVLLDFSSRLYIEKVETALKNGRDVKYEYRKNGTTLVVASCSPSYS